MLLLKSKVITIIIIFYPPEKSIYFQRQDLSVLQKLLSLDFFCDRPEIMYPIPVMKAVRHEQGLSIYFAL